MTESVRVKKFDYKTVPSALLTPETVALLTALHECKGRQEVLLSGKPALLESLAEVARVQSTGASNRIEGIGTTDKRLRELMAEKIAPRNRDEREIAGYREVLSLIHGSHEHIEPTPNVILQLHRTLYSFSGDGAGGAWKNNDNMISETGADGRRYVRFRPVPALQTPDAMARLCAAFAEAWQTGAVDKLMVSLMFVLDFLCIHPFNDGNGRMSRLLTLLLFYRAGHTAGKYISVEKIIEESKATYYETLQDSSRGWHENRNDYAPFVCYGLGVLLKANRELDARAACFAGKKPSKPDRIKSWIDGRLSAFGKRDILAALPDISKITVERMLAEMVKAGTIAKRGAGPATKYVNVKDRHTSCGSPRAGGETWDL